MLATIYFHCILNRSFEVSTKFGEDRSNSKEMVTIFENPSWIVVT